MLTLRAHRSPTYPPRTFENAGGADLTAAFALDFSTAGEKLTRKAANGRYAALPLENPAVDNARLLFAALRERAVERPTLNIAGNGIYSLAPLGWDQDRVNAYMHAVLSLVHTHWPLGRVVSGGQTGIDWAGAVAATALRIPAAMTFPAGFLQRGLDNRDVPGDVGALRAQAMEQARVLAGS